MKTTMITVLMLLGVVQFLDSRNSRENVVIDEAVNSDYYVAGRTVTINAPIHGDLIVAGGTVIVNDTVTQDVIVSGGNIVLNGFVGDDVRCAGFEVTIKGEVRGDLVSAGGKIIVDRAATVGGGVFSTGGEVTMNGVVNGNVKDASAELTINGSVEKDLDVRGDKVIVNGRVGGKSIIAASDIELGTSAEFADDVTYWNESGSLDFGNHLQGQAVYDPKLEIETGKWHYLGFASLFMVVWYLGTALLVIALLQYFFGGVFKTAANTVKQASLKSLGVGVLYFVGGPIIIALLFATVIGLPVAVLLLLLYVAVIIFATSIVSLLISNWINNSFYRASWKRGKLIIAALGIFVILKLASLTPLLGPVIMLLLVCMGLGGIILNLKWKKTYSLPSE